MPARIVEIDATNARCLDAVAPDVFDNAVDAVQLNRFVGDPRHILVVAIDDGLVVGMATAVLARRLGMTVLSTTRNPGRANVLRNIGVQHRW